MYCPSYFTNTDASTYSRLPLSLFTGFPITNPPVTTLADNVFPDVILDDFTIHEQGNAWVASGRGEVLLLRKVTRRGRWGG
jgi:sugar lactone lactonase YvrE